MLREARVSPLANRVRAGVVLCASLAVLVTIVPAAGGTASRGSARLRAHAATTGNDSERVATIPITRHAGQKPQVVMSLPPRELPRASPRRSPSGERRSAGDDNLRGPKGAAASGAPTASPLASTRRSSSRPEATGPAGGAPARLGRRQSLSCHQQRPNRNHHCVLVPTGSRKIGHPRRLPCRRRNCHLNLVVDAHDGDAQRGNVLVIGADRPDGSIVEDAGRLNALVVPKRPRSATRAPSHTPSGAPVDPDGIGGGRGKARHLLGQDAATRQAGHPDHQGPPDEPRSANSATAPM